MTKQLKINVNGKPYPLHFGYGANRRLGAILGIDSYDGTVQRVLDVVNQMAAKEKEGGGLPYETMDTIGYMVVSAMPLECDVEMEDVVDVLFKDMKLIQDIFDGWAQSMPRGDGGDPEKKTSTKSDRKQRL